MNNNDVLVKLTDKILSSSKELFKTLEKYVDSLETFSIPTYNSLKDPEVFLVSNQEYTQLSSNNHLFKVKIAKLNIDVSMIINEITKYKLSSTSQNLISELKKVKEKSSLYKEALEEQQKNIDAVLKHLQLCSYTMNSPYVD